MIELRRDTYHPLVAFESHEVRDVTLYKTGIISPNIFPNVIPTIVPIRVYRARKANLHVFISVLATIVNHNVSVLVQQLVLRRQLYALAPEPTVVRRHRLSNV
jgi:hypothetical protein